MNETIFKEICSRFPPENLEATSGILGIRDPILDDFLDTPIVWDDIEYEMYVSDVPMSCFKQDFKNGILKQHDDFLTKFIGDLFIHKRLPQDYSKIKDLPHIRTTLKVQWLKNELFLNHGFSYPLTIYGIGDKLVANPGFTRLAVHIMYEKEFPVIENAICYMPKNSEYRFPVKHRLDTLGDLRKFIDTYNAGAGIKYYDDDIHDKQPRIHIAVELENRDIIFEKNFNAIVSRSDIYLNHHFESRLRKFLTFF